ncbi:MAG: hypothetical protein R3B13_02955 [Polyangiaceae bacterium]
MGEDGDEQTAGGFFGFLSRRRALRLALGAGATLLAGAGGLRALRGDAPPVDGLRALGVHEYRTLDALAQIHLPIGGPFEPGAAGLDLARVFDTFLADEHPENIRDLRRALTLLEFGPLLFERRLVTFSNLAPDARLRHWLEWGASESLLRRQVAFAFRKFLSFVFYDTPTIWKHIGYPGPSLRGAP